MADDLEEDSPKHEKNEVIHVVLKKPPDRPRSKWEHPLTLLVVGFLLSGVLGTWITMTVQSREAERESVRREDDARRDKELRHYESSTKAVVDFSNALYLRYVRAGMLKSALARASSPDEIRQRKLQYDEALVQQESTVLSSHLLFREALKEQDYDDWEADYQYGLKPRLSNLDKQLTELTDEYLRHPHRSNPASARMRCVNDLYDQTRKCDSAIVNAIFRSLSSRQYLSGGIVIDTQQKAKADVMAQCPAPPSQSDCGSDPVH